MSYTRFKATELKPLGKLFLFLFKTLHMVDLREVVGEDGGYVEVNNFTLNNFILKLLGPVHEGTLVIILLSIQVCATVIDIFLVTYLCISL